MSSYHFAVKKFLLDVDKFLNVSLKSENLSNQAKKERDHVIEQLQKLFTDYTSLASSGDEGSTSSTKDTGANSSIGEESWTTVESSHGSEEDNYTDNVPDTTVKALTGYVKTGYLEKKNTGYEFREAPQNHKDAAKKDFCFELVGPGKKTHAFLGSSKEDVTSWKEAFQSASVSADTVDANDDIYEEMPAEKPVRKNDIPVPVPIITNDQPEQYYEDGTSLASQMSTQVELKRQASPLPSPKIKADDREQEKLDYDDDLIYEPVDTPSRHPPLPSPVSPTVSDTPPPLPPHIPHILSPSQSDNTPPPLPVRNTPLPPPPVEPLPQLPQPRKKMITLGKMFHPSEDFENMFYGVWKNESSSSQELSFDRGQIIHIISRDLDIDDWWVGELDGKIGLVPKTFLVPAYEMVY